MIAVLEIAVVGIATLFVTMWALVAAIDADAEKKFRKKVDK